VGSVRDRALALLVVAAFVAILSTRACGGDATSDAPRSGASSSVANLAPQRPTTRARQETTAPQIARPASSPQPTEAPSPEQRFAVRVVAADGSPAAGARVAFADANAREELSPSVTTDADGRASLSAPSRTSDVRVRATRGEFVALGVVRDEPLDGEEIRLAPTVTVRGRVTDAAGAPLADVWMSAQPSALAVFASYPCATTGVDGAFAFVLPADACADGIVVNAGRPGWTSVHRSVPLETARRDVVAIALLATRRAKGRCVTSDGTPVEGAQVQVRDGGRDWAKTKDDGLFASYFDAAESVAVTVWPKSHVARVASAAAAKEGDTDLGDVVLDEGGEIAGRVLDEAGAPLESATVTAFAAGLGAARQAQSDAEGNFVLEHVGDGPFALDAESFAIDDAPRHGRVEGVRVGEKNARITLRPGRAIRLRIVSAEDGRPLAVARYEWRIRRCDGAGGDVSSGTFGGGAATSIPVRVPSAGRYDVAFFVPGRKETVLRGLDVTDDAIAAADVVLWKP